jgi:hypothetical protein
MFVLCPRIEWLEQTSLQAYVTPFLDPVICGTEHETDLYIRPETGRKHHKPRSPPLYCEVSVVPLRNSYEGTLDQRHIPDPFDPKHGFLLDYVDDVIAFMGMLNHALHHPAVHIYRLAGNELSLIRCQECHHVGYILRVTVVSKRDVLPSVPLDCLLA